MLGCPDRDEEGTGNEVNEANRVKLEEKVILKPILGSQKNGEQVNVIDWNRGETTPQYAPFGNMGTTGEVNMEATIIPDDVIRGGGFGARDDISSFLPAASDSTDFEASIRDAQDYEQTRKEVHRPGLGWKEETDKV